jgi:hypothetical protein
VTAAFQFEPGEPLLPLDEAVKTWCEPDWHYDYSTLRTYATREVGDNLPHFDIDGRLRTSARALEWFFGRNKPKRRAHGRKLKAGGEFIPAPGPELPGTVTLELDEEVRGALNAMADHLGAIRQTLDELVSAMGMMLDRLEGGTAPVPANGDDSV